MTRSLCVWSLVLALGAPPLGAYLTSVDTQVSDVADSQLSPAVAHRYAGGSDHFLVVFRAGIPDEILWGQRTDAMGNPVGEPFIIADNPEHWPPRVAHSASSDRFLVVWSEGSETQGA
ncbi:hypothetical protein JXA47_13710, partial [Candidatus Sumerlaeota bacterium]|nr:hypothetical protein [Candidatus Sumerlaeota bacterium]